MSLKRWKTKKGACSCPDCSPQVKKRLPLVHGSMVTLCAAVPMAHLRAHSIPNDSGSYGRLSKIQRGDIAIVLHVSPDGDCMITSGKGTGWLTGEAFEVLQ